MIVVGCILAAGIGTSLYMNMKGGTETDQAAAATKTKFTCSKCSQEFELTTAEARNQLGSGKGIVCPKCGASETRKTNAIANLGGKTFTSNDESTEADEATDDTAPKRKTMAINEGGGSKKKKRSGN
jgi:DNA-directed RNA polymerase subunit RPC12/RpoP